jgi:hypothetical protein
MCFSKMFDCHMRRLERIQWKSGRICIGLMRSTHVLSVEVLAGLPAIRQMLSFLNERFLVSALVKPNDLLMVKLKELHRIWNKSNWLSVRIMYAPYIILTDSLTSIKGLRSFAISYQTNDMLFRTRRSLRYLREPGYNIILSGPHLMWVSNRPMYWQMSDRSLEICFRTKLDRPQRTRLTFTLAQVLDCCQNGIGKRK